MKLPSQQDAESSIKPLFALALNGLFIGGGFMLAAVVNQSPSQNLLHILLMGSFGVLLGVTIGMMIEISTVLKRSDKVDEIIFNLFSVGLGMIPGMGIAAEVGKHTEITSKAGVVGLYALCMSATSLSTVIYRQLRVRHENSVLAASGSSTSLNIEQQPDYGSTAAHNEPYKRDRERRHGVIDRNEEAHFSAELDEFNPRGVR